MIGGSEILLILLVVLLLFGADKIPGIARGLGKGLNEIKKATDEIKNEINNSTSDVRQEITNIKNDVTNGGEEMNRTIYPNLQQETIVEEVKKDKSADNNIEYNI